MISFDGTVTTGGQYVPADDGGDQAMTVMASKEVILAAGSIHTPQVLQLSGIGPSTLLRRANIPVVVDLLGVGSNFQDHSYIPSIMYGCKERTHPSHGSVVFSLPSIWLMLQTNG